jgi:hypothetical protein
MTMELSRATWSPAIKTTPHPMKNFMNFILRRLLSKGYWCFGVFFFLLQYFALLVGVVAFDVLSMLSSREMFSKATNHRIIAKNRNEIHRRSQGHY